MVINATSCNLAERSKAKKKQAAVIVVIAAASLIQHHFSARYDKTPKNTSKLTGQQWLNELLAGHPQRFYDGMGMNKHVFQVLLNELIKHGLHDTRHVSAEEQLAIFLYLAVTGLPQRHLEERFQHSPSTLTKCVVILILTRLKTDLNISHQSHPLHSRPPHVRHFLSCLRATPQCKYSTCI
jgi:hypothetical protein